MKHAKHLDSEEIISRFFSNGAGSFLYLPYWMRKNENSLFEQQKETEICIKIKKN